MCDSQRRFCYFRPATSAKICVFSLWKSCENMWRRDKSTSCASDCYHPWLHFFPLNPALGFSSPKTPGFSPKVKDEKKHSHTSSQLYLFNILHLIVSEALILKGFPCLQQQNRTASQRIHAFFLFPSYRTTIHILSGSCLSLDFHCACFQLYST